MLGFGIDGAEKTKAALALGVDGVIIGSKIISILTDKDFATAQAEIKELLQNMLDA